MRTGPRLTKAALLEHTNKIRRELADFLRQNRGVAIWLALGIIFIIFRFIWIEADSKRVQYYLSLVTGNWSPPSDFSVIAEWEFGLTAIFAILINWLPLIGAVGLIYGFFRPLLAAQLQRERDTTLNMTQALSVRTATEKALVLSSLEDFPEARVRVTEAFAAASMQWQEHLKDMIGESRARQVFRILEQELPAIDD